MRAILVKPDLKPEIIDLSEDLKQVDELIGDDWLMLMFNDSYVICNEKKQTEQAEPNCEYNGMKLYGTIIVTGEKNGRMASV